MALYEPQALTNNLQKVRDLDRASRAIVELLAMVYQPVTRTDLSRALNKLGHRSDLAPLLDSLARRTLVQDRKRLSLRQDLYHPAMLCAVEGEDFQALVDVVHAVWHDDTIRGLRVALYTGQWEDASRLTQALGSEPLLGICEPLDQAWVTELPADVRRAALRAVLDASARSLEPAREAYALLDAEPELDLDAHRILIEQMVLRGRFDDADGALEGWTSVDAAVARAWLLFLRGRRGEAITAYEAALRAHLKQEGKRARFFPGRAGAFFVAALLDDEQPASRARAEALLDDARRPNITTIPHAYEVLSEVAAVKLGDKAPEALLHINPLFGYPFGLDRLDPFEVLMRVLGAVWIGSRADPETAGHLAELAFKADEAGYAWFAGQAAAALLRAGVGLHEARLRKLREGVPGVLLTNLFVRPDAWSKKLDALLQVVSAKRENADDDAFGHDRRLVWLIVEEHGHLTLAPREQVRQKGGFTKGRPVALKRLYEEASKMAFLRPQDREVCRTIQEDVSFEYYGRYRNVSYTIDEDRALRALVGHPAVFTERRSSGELIPAEVRIGRVRLRAERVPEGVRLTLDPTPRSNEETCSIRRVGDTAVEVVEFTEAHHGIARALGKKGLVVPSAAEARVRTVLGALSGVVAVDTEVKAGAEVKAVAGDPKPRAILRPLGQGLSVELVVRPLGSGGPTARAGRGGTTMLAEVAGQRRQASRDLAAEARLLDEVLAACPALASAERTEAGFALPDLERALDALVELRAQGKRIELEWPEGELLLVTDELTLDKARFSVRTDGDELSVEGTLALPGGRRIGLSEVLDYLAAAPGRFLKLKGDQRYLALHEELRERLAELAFLMGPSGKRPGLPGLLAPLLDDVLTGAQVDADKAFEQRLAELAPGGGGPDPEVPKTFCGELRPYQLDGFRWLARLGRLRAGACLADDMGLGKTVQSLALLVLRAPEGPSLVVAPTSVVPVWLDEAARFAPTLEPRLYAGEGRAEQLSELGPFDLLVTSYALLQQDIEQLSAVPWVVALLDEAQAIKNVETRRAQASKELRALQRIATTGTPIENRLDDLYGIFRFLNPTLVGSAESFAARFARPIERDGDAGARARLRRVVGPFILRRSKTDVLPELPPRTEVTLRIGLSVEEIALYEALRAEALSSLDRTQVNVGQRRIQILAAITRLRRAASHARMVLPEAEAVGSKLNALGELLDEILPGGHRVLIFSQFVDHLTLLRAFLDERKVSYQYLDGSTPAAKRRAAIDAFQAGRGEAFLISLRAGGFGLNLTAADYVVHLDPWWNPAVEDQASDRAHRIGQTRAVTIYRLVARDTIEDQILALHHKKRELAASLLEGGEACAQMTEEELLDLVRAGRAEAEGSAPARRGRRARRG